MHVLDDGLFAEFLGKGDDRFGNDTCFFILVDIFDQRTVYFDKIGIYLQNMFKIGVAAAKIVDSHFGAILFDVLDKVVNHLVVMNLFGFGDLKNDTVCVSGGMQLAIDIVDNLFIFQIFDGQVKRKVVGCVFKSCKCPVNDNFGDLLIQFRFFCDLQKKPGRNDFAVLFDQTHEGFIFFDFSGGIGDDRLKKCHNALFMKCFFDFLNPGNIVFIVLFVSHVSVICQKLFVFLFCRFACQ